MSSATYGKNLSRGRFKIAVPILGLALAAASGFGGGAAWADQALQPEGAAAKVGRQQLFGALDQWMAQNRAAYNYDILKLQDPFLPIKAVRGMKPGNEPFISYFTQLKLVAITRYKSGSKFLASFEDGAGSGYNLRVGDSIGPHDERVVKINSSTVTVESPGLEEGEPARISEIKLPSPGQTAGLTRSGQAQPLQRAD